MYDLVLAGGTIVDGTRAAPFVGSLCIKDGRIVNICDNAPVPSLKTIDVTGKIVSPGFIDIHAHSEACPLIAKPYNPESKLFQGITTELAGNCGISIVPNCNQRRAQIVNYFACCTELQLGDTEFDFNSVEGYGKRVDNLKPATNYCTLIGHGTLRGCVMGFDDRDPNPEELEQLKELLDAELTKGAFGMSLGLIYPPSAFCHKEELVELAKIVKKHDAILAVHMRNEGPKVFESVEEMLEITQRSGVHLHISHLKLMGKPQWHRAGELLQKIEDARAKGLNITCDQYPYNATSTSLSALVPKWAHDGGTDKMLERLRGKEPRLLKEIAQEMENRGGPSCVLVTGTQGHVPEAEQKTIEEIAPMFKISPEETVAELLVRGKGSAAAVYFSLNDEDVAEIMRDMRIAIGSDGYGFSYDRKITTTTPHPRSFGTFPRFLRLNRELKLMPIQDAVYKITGLSADIMGLPDRGVLKIGNVADVTVFDEQEVFDVPDFADSVVKPRGIEYVIVGGKVALVHNEQTEERAGRMLYYKRG